MSRHCKMTVRIINLERQKIWALKPVVGLDSGTKFGKHQQQRNTHYKYAYKKIATGEPR